MTTLHPNLPPLPTRMKRLRVDERGFPVPWFVLGEIDDETAMRLAGGGLVTIKADRAL